MIAPARERLPAGARAADATPPSGRYWSKGAATTRRRGMVREGMSTLLATASTIAAAASTVASSTVASSTQTTEPAIVSLVTTVVPSLVATILPSGVTTAAASQVGAVTLAAPAEITAAFIGALAGAAKGVERRFDFLGIATLAVVTGLGGGIIRDLLLQKYGIYAFENPRMLLSALAAAVFGFFFVGLYRKVRKPLVLLDMVSLGVFAVIGADKALLAGLLLLPAILLGSITSVGGGLLRDILCDEQPKVMQPGSLFASAAVLGSTVYVLLVGWLGIVKPIASVAAILVVVALRGLSLALGWQSREAVDLTPKVVSAGKTVLAPARHRFGKSASTSGDEESPEADAEAQTGDRSEET